MKLKSNNPKSNNLKQFKKFYMKKLKKNLKKLFKKNLYNYQKNLFLLSVLKSL